MEECGRVNLNARINLLYFLDTLLDKQAPGQPYKEFVRRDLAKLVEMVVPDTREGVLNLMSTNQASWGGRTSRRARGADGCVNRFYDHGRPVDYSTQTSWTPS